MADLILDWDTLGDLTAIPAVAPGGVSTSVETGGVAVDIAFTPSEPGAVSFTFDTDGFVGAGEPFDGRSFLKLSGAAQDSTTPQATSTTVLSFRSTDTDQFGDAVQDVSFRLNDIDRSDSNNDLSGPAGPGFEDQLQVLAFDPDGNPLPVTITPSGAVDVTGDTLTGTTTTTAADADGSALVSIPGPVGRIEFVYDNGGPSGQVALISDIVFSTTPAGDNQPPVAVDDAIETDEDTPVTENVLGNDTDPDGDPLTLTEVSDPANGTVTFTPEGEITYTPDPDFNGTDTVTYTVTDPDGATDTGTVTFTVNPVNDAPVANPDAETTPQGVAVTENVLANDTDPDGDPLTLTDVSTPVNGTVTFTPDGNVTFTPDPDFTGDEVLTYTISDGNGGTASSTVTFTVDPDVPPPPPPDAGRIDDDVFPVPPEDQALDPLDGLDEDPDPNDNRDSIDGTGGDDVLVTGGDDADTVNGGAGNDTIEAGIDDDLVDGGTGDDLITDVQGSDTISGGQGNDTIIAGVDTFSDYENDDPNLPLTIGGTTFTSDPNPEDGRDLVFGNQGDDSISTGDDRDTIIGGQGDDTIDGGIDDDMIEGRLDNDSLIGGHGSDTIDGGGGDDFIDGSNIPALELTDDIDPNPENDRDFLFGATGNDTVLGGDDDDTLQGNGGDDLLDGGIDDDTLSGGNGNDTLIGGQGNDSLNGDAGADSIDGGADRDTIFVTTAEQGTNDTVQGGSAGDDFDTLDLTGVGQRDVDWRLTNVTDDFDGLDADGNPLSNGIDGTVEFLDGAGGVTGSFDFFNIEQVVPCFTPGTLIATPQGERLVEDLREGDRIITRDNGIQQIRWVGRKDLTGHDLARKPHMKPVLVRKGSLGNDLPEHDLLLSPNHRVLVNNDKTALYFEEREVLAAAKHLTGLEGVDPVSSLGVSYVHFMFERHEVVLSNGAWTESFQPGDYSLKGIGNAQRQEILELFPDLQHEEGITAYASARRSLKKHEAKLLAR